MQPQGKAIKYYLLKIFGWNQKWETYLFVFLTKTVARKMEMQIRCQYMFSYQSPITFVSWRSLVNILNHMDD